MRNKQILFLILAIFTLSISKSEAQSIVSDSTVHINELDEYDLIFDPEQDDVNFQLINRVNPSLSRLRKFSFSHISVNLRGDICRLDQFRINKILMSNLNNNGNLWNIISSINNLKPTQTEDITPFGSQQLFLQSPNRNNRASLRYGVASAKGLNTIGITLCDPKFNISGGSKWGKDNTFDGIFTENYSLNANYDFRLGRHNTLSLGTIVSSSKRGLKYCTTEEVFQLVKQSRHNDYYGYSPSIGIQNGKNRNASVAENKSAMINLNDRWDISDNTTLNISLGAIYDKQGYSALGRFDSNNPLPDYYQYLPSYYTGSTAQSITDLWVSDPKTAMIDWHEMYQINHSQKRAKYIIEQRVAELNSIRTNFSVNHSVSSRLRAEFMVDGIIERSNYNKVLDDMLGSEYWLDIDTYLVDDVFYGDMVQNNTREPNRKIVTGDKFGYNYSLDNCLIESTLRANYRNKGLVINAQYSVGHNSTQRIGHYEKEMFPAEKSFGKSQKINFTTQKFALSIHYFTAAGYELFTRLYNGSRAPLSRDIMISPRNQNKFVDTPNTPRTISAEFGLAAKRSWGEFYVTLFSHKTKSLNQIFNRYDEITTRYSHFVTTNISTESLGIDFESVIELSDYIELECFASFGRYEYANDPIFKQYDDRDGKLLNDNIIAHIEGQSLHYAPQCLATARVNWQPRFGLWIGGSVNYCSERATKLDMLRRTERILSLTDNFDVKDRLLKNTPLKECCTIDFNIGKRISWGRHSLTLNLQIKNLTNQYPERYGYEQYHLTRIGKGSRKYYDTSQIKKCYDYGRSFNFSVSYTL